MKIPKLPSPEELKFREKSFLLVLYEQYQRASKIWFLIFLAVLVLAFPLKILLQHKLTASLVASQKPLSVNENPYQPEEIRILQAETLPVAPGIFSAYARLHNPNPALSARNFQYRFVFRNQQAQVFKEVRGTSYLPAGESRFLLLPSLNLPALPQATELVLEKVRWTALQPLLEIELEVLQKNFGQTPEGNFFAEGIVKNQGGFGIQRVEVKVLVFDQTNQNLLAVNATVLSDLKPLEGRYFRVLWPVGNIGISTPLGQVVMRAELDPLEPGLILEEGKKFPAR